MPETTYKEFYDNFELANPFYVSSWVKTMISYTLGLGPMAKNKKMTQAILYNECVYRDFIHNNENSPVLVQEVANNLNPHIKFTKQGEYKTLENSEYWNSVKWQNNVPGSFLHIRNKFSGRETITLRMYVSLNYLFLHEFVAQFEDQIKSQKLQFPCYFKINPLINPLINEFPRNDNMVIYTNAAYMPYILNAIEELVSTFEDDKASLPFIYNPPLMSMKLNKGSRIAKMIGFAPETKEFETNDTSYNAEIARLFFNLIHTEKFKEVAYPFELDPSPQEILSNIESNFENIKKVLDDVAIKTVGYSIRHAMADTLNLDSLDPNTKIPNRKQDDKNSNWNTQSENVNLSDKTPLKRPIREQNQCCLLI
jgi:hypothetical protein